MSPRGFVLLSLLLSSTVSAQRATTQPVSTQASTQASTQPAATEWRHRLDELADPNPATRDEARETLMKLSREDLPALADVARDAMPLRPAQRALLREIVEQVYLTGEHHFAGFGSGYIGISDMSSVSDPQAAIVVRRRIVGYDAYRVLQLGDVIVSVAPQKAGVAGLKPVAGITSLRNLLAGSKPGDWILMHITRNGAESNVSIRLGPVPQQNQGQEVIVMTDEAAKYWTETFSKRLQRPTTAPHP